MKLSLFTAGEHLYDVPIGGSPVQIGRDALNDLVLPDRRVERFHACLRRRGRAVEALARSARVVLVREDGEVEVERALLQPPATLRFGAFLLALRDDLAAPAVPAAAACATGPAESAALATAEPLAGAEPPEGARRNTRPAGRPAEHTRLALRLEPEGIERSLDRPLCIGSAPDNDLVIDDPYVSAHHCRVVERQGRLWLIDRGSRNGTVVNGARVDLVELSPGLRLGLGDRELLVVPAGTAGRRPKVRRYHGMLSADPLMHALFEQIEKLAAATDRLHASPPVLVLGESGTGKELVARALHEASPVRNGPFVAKNCGANSPELMESELFGHERGAFTGATSRRRGLFEQANGGTLFLDEIGELPLALQPKLLRVLETRRVRRVGGEEEIPVQVRLVAATHRTLADEVSRGQFRLDLYHRLAVITLRLPPLRRRQGDVPLLLHEFLRQERPGEGPRLLAPGVLDQLAAYAWPGNVRELRNAVSRALAQGEGPLTLRDFLGDDHDGGAGQQDPLIRAGGRRLADIEREAIQLELARQRGNRRRTAAVLGVARSTLGEKLRKLGLSR